METHDLRTAGLKVTVPRVKILTILETHNTERHLTAEQIHRILSNNDEDIGLATVYRVLTQFETAGLVTRHHFEGGQSVFELTTDHHDHIVCLRCGVVDEFTDEMIEHRQREIAQNLGYELSHHALHLYGICSKCRHV